MPRNRCWRPGLVGPDQRVPGVVAHHSCLTQSWLRAATVFLGINTVCGLLPRAVEETFAVWLDPRQSTLTA